MRNSRHGRGRIVGRLSVLGIATIGLVLAACGNEPAPAPPELPSTTTTVPAETPSPTPSSPQVIDHLLMYTGANPAAAVSVLAYPIQRAGSFVLPPSAGFPPLNWAKLPAACAWADDDGVLPVAMTIRAQWANMDNSPGETPYRVVVRFGLEPGPGSAVVGYEILYRAGSQCYEAFEATSIGVEIREVRFDFPSFIYGYVRLPDYFAPDADNAWVTDLRLRFDRVEIAGQTYRLPERVGPQRHTSDEPPTVALVTGRP